MIRAILFAVIFAVLALVAFALLAPLIFQGNLRAAGAIAFPVVMLVGGGFGFWFGLRQSRRR